MSDVTLVSTTSDVTLVSMERMVTFVQVGVQGPAGPSAHGELSGLALDQHTQYHTDARGDARYTPLAHASDTDNPHDVTAAQVGADAAGTAAAAVSGHAGGTSVHSIAAVTGLQTALDGKSSTSHDHAGGGGLQIAYSSLSGMPTLGTAAALDVGTTANKVVQLDVTGKLPAVDGSQLTNFPLVGVITDHGDLSGLADDDHTQYHNNTRGDARYSVLAHDHSGTYEVAGSVATHAALTTTHGISAFGATLVDDAAASNARTTLGLGGSATLNVGTTAGTVAAGDDSRLSDSRTPVGHTHATGDVTGFSAAALAAAPAETTSTVGTLIAGATVKSAPVDADSFGLSDSEAGGILRKLTWGAFKTAFNGIFARLAGVAGGQTLIGGTGAGDALTLQGTSASGTGSAGALVFKVGNNGHIQAVTIDNTGAVGVGVSTPSARLHVLSTSEQLRVGYDTSTSASLVVNNLGEMTISSTGGTIRYQGNASTDGPTYGSELLSSGGWTVTSGWTESPANVFAHSNGGGTTALTHSATIANATKYQVSWTVSGRTSGNFLIALGGVSSNGYTSTGSFGPTSVSTAAFTITPSNDFNGTISLTSCKVITGASKPLLSYNNTVGVTNEIRSQLNTSCLYIGTNSGRYLTSGSYDTAVGASAQCFITSGTSDTAIGYAAQYSITFGSCDTAVGYAAQYYLTTGSYNVCLGYNSQRFLPDGATGVQVFDQCVHIGAASKVSAENTTNEIAVGYNSVGIGSNTSVIGNSSTTKFKAFGSPFFTPAASVTPTVNGELVIEATSNTSVTIKLKGTDGTVRSVALTLS